MNKIKQAGLSDLDELSRLFDMYRVFYQKEPDPEKAKAFLKARMELNESVIFVSLNNENSLTGFVQLYPLYSSTRMQRLWLLNDLYVLENCRGQGISVLLIEKAKEFCKETHGCGLMLETARTNGIGNKLYPRTGFELDTEHHYYFWEA